MHNESISLLFELLTTSTGDCSMLSQVCEVPLSPGQLHRSQPMKLLLVPFFIVFQWGLDAAILGEAVNQCKLLTWVTEGSWTLDTGTKSYALLTLPLFFSGKDKTCIGLALNLRVRSGLSFQKSRKTRLSECISSRLLSPNKPRQKSLLYAPANITGVLR